MSVTYFVRARTGQSSVIVGAASEVDAIERARELRTPRSIISIAGTDGEAFTVDEFEQRFAGAGQNRAGDATV